MNLPEGARRLRMAGCWLMLILPLVLVAQYVFLLGLRAISVLVVLYISSMIPGAALFFVAWIVEGFAKEHAGKATLEH